jgi:hypothetical protein
MLNEDAKRRAAWASEDVWSSPGLRRAQAQKGPQTTAAGANGQPGVFRPKSGPSPAQAAKEPANGRAARNDAISACRALGLSRKQAEGFMREILAEEPESEGWDTSAWVGAICRRSVSNA